MGELLTEVSRLNGRNWSLRRQVRKAERAKLDLRTQLAIAMAEGSQMANAIRALEADGVQEALPTAERPMVPAWSAALVAVGLLGLALALVVRRRRHLELGVPDPIAPPLTAKPAPQDAEVGAR